MREVRAGNECWICLHSTVCKYIYMYMLEINMMMTTMMMVIIVLICSYSLSMGASINRNEI